jgi:hypothetical protein
VIAAVPRFMSFMAEMLLAAMQASPEAQTTTSRARCDPAIFG